MQPLIPNDEEIQSTEPRLESWKAIAAYLQRNTTTARRWEREEGLPVHRHSHKSRASVYAYAFELDAWREARKPDAEPEPERIALWGSPLSSFATAILLLLALMAVGDTPPGLFQAQAQGMSTKLVWEGAETVSSVFYAGRIVSYTNWSPATNPETGQVASGGLAIRDLDTGEERQLTWEQDGNGQFVDESMVSPDGRWVAYAEWHDNQSEKRLRLIPVDGSEAPQTILTGPNYFQIKDWSPDGAALLISRSSGDGSWQLVSIDVEDGTLHQLKSLQWRRQLQAKFSPDGRYIAYDALSQDGRDTDVYVISADGSEETAVLEGPVSDRSPVWSPDGSLLLFVSARTAVPSLWSIPMEEGEPVGPAGLVKSDIGPSFGLELTRSGALRYMIRARDRRNIQVVALNEIGHAAGAPEVATDTYFNSNWGADLSLDGTHLAFLSSRPRQTLVIRDIATGEEDVFPIEGGQVPPIFQQGPRWFPDGSSVKIGLVARPREFLARVDTKTGEMEEFEVPEAASGSGMMKIASDGRTVIYRSGVNEISRYDLVQRKQTVLVLAGDAQVSFFEEPSEEASAVTQSIGDLAVSPDGRWLAYKLDDYESGQYLYVMPSEGGEPREIFHGSPGSLGGANSLTWTPDGKYLLKASGGTVWRYPVDGGDREEIGVSVDGSIFGLHVSPDGTRLYFSTIANNSEIWQLENFLPGAEE